MAMRKPSDEADEEAEASRLASSVVEETFDAIGDAHELLRNTKPLKGPSQQHTPRYSVDTSPRVTSEIASKFQRLERDALVRNQQERGLNQQLKSGYVGKKWQVSAAASRTTCSPTLRWQDTKGSMKATYPSSPNAQHQHSTIPQQRSSSCGEGNNNNSHSNNNKAAEQLRQPLESANSEINPPPTESNKGPDDHDGNDFPQKESGRDCEHEVEGRIPKERLSKDVTASTAMPMLKPMLPDEACLGDEKDSEGRRMSTKHFSFSLGSAENAGSPADACFNDDMERMKWKPEYRDQNSWGSSKGLTTSRKKGCLPCSFLKKRSTSNWKNRD